MHQITKRMLLAAIAIGIIGNTPVKAMNDDLETFQAVMKTGGAFALITYIGKALYSWQSFELPPLESAIINGTREELETLISNDPKLLTKKNLYGDTPLMHGLKYGNIYHTKTLINKGKALTEKDRYGDTPLTYNLKYGNFYHSLMLIEKDAALTEPDQYGNTPLQIAQKQDLTQVIEALQKKGIGTDLCLKTAQSEQTKFRAYLANTLATVACVGLATVTAIISSQ